MQATCFLPLLSSILFLTHCAPQSSNVDDPDISAESDISVKNTGSSDCEGMSWLKTPLDKMGSVKIGDFSICDMTTHAGGVTSVGAGMAESSWPLFNFMPKKLGGFLGKASLAAGAAYYTLCGTAPAISAMIDVNQSQCSSNNAGATRILNSFFTCMTLRNMHPERKSWFTDWCPSRSSGATYCAPKSVVTSNGRNYYPERSLRCVANNDATMFAPNDEVVGWPVVLDGKTSVKNLASSCVVHDESLACVY